MVGKWIDEALRKQVRGEEKVHVISHLLHGLYTCISSQGFVGFYEPHRKKSGRYYVHILCIAGGDQWISHLDLLCDHTIDMYADGTVPSTVAEERRPSKSRPRRWSIQNLSLRKLSVPFSPTSSPSTRGGHDASHTKQLKYRVYDYDTSHHGMDVHHQLCGLFHMSTKHESGSLVDCVGGAQKAESPVHTHNDDHVDSCARDGMVFSYHRPSDQTDTMDFVKGVANTLHIITELYRSKEHHRGQQLKERIFNEVVQTLTLPLVVFDVRSIVATRDGLVDPKKLICTYYNDAFVNLTCRASDDGHSPLKESHDEHHDDHGQSSSSSSKVGVLDVHTPPVDQAYCDENHHVFAKFLSHPAIFEALERIMQSFPLKVSIDGSVVVGAAAGCKGKRRQGGCDSKSKGEEQERKSSLSSDRSNSGSLDHGNESHQTLSIEYQDHLIPHGHYEIDIYRVNGTRFGVVFRDVSEKMHHLQLIEQASKAKSEFLGNINHEFRTPLNSIDGNLQLLARTQPLTDRQKDLIHRMRLAETSLMSLLQEVLDYAKLEQHRVRLNHETFSLRHCLEATLEVTQALVTKQRNYISYEMALDVPTLVVGDSWRLQQVLVNLITNANKFTQNGSVTIQVNVHKSEDTLNGNTVDDAADELVFTVMDTGRGIDASLQERLFMPWVQDDSTDYRAEDRGAGLGLAICKELCTLMGGSIWLDHSSERGSQFSFTIKFGRADLVDTETLAQNEMDIVHSKEILVMHPDPTVRKTLLKQMLKWGARPTMCWDVDEVRDFLGPRNNDRFHLLVLGHITGECAADVTTCDTIRLAQWVTGRHPQLPMIASGDLVSINSDACNQLFRKVVPEPIHVNSIFHLMVNLFVGAPRLNKTLKSADAAHQAMRDATAVVAEAAAEQRKLSLEHLDGVGGRCHQPWRNPSQSQSMPLLGNMDHFRCLVVEDVEANRKVLVEMLHYLGCTHIDTAENGQEMLDMVGGHAGAGAGEYTVVFLDLLMPVMSGMEAVKKYRENHPLGTRPYIVAVTATSLIGSERESYQRAGMDAFIQKPVKMNELKTLLEVIRAHISQVK